MTNFDYNEDLPNPPNDPSQDAPGMQVNTNSVAGLIAEDHVGFMLNNGGLHNKARLVNQTGMPPPLNVGAGMGTIYTKFIQTLATPPTSESTLFYTPDITANEYQMTRSISAFGATFGKNISYFTGTFPTNITYTGGWTFLPGGMLLQYGVILYATTVNNSFPVTFPVPFTSPAFGVFTQDISATDFADPRVSNPTTTQFMFSETNTIVGTKVAWWAIGV